DSGTGRGFIRGAVQGDLKPLGLEVQDQVLVVLILQRISASYGGASRRQWPDSLRSNESVFVQEIVHRACVFDVGSVGIVNYREGESFALRPHDFRCSVQHNWPPDYRDRPSDSETLAAQRESRGQSSREEWRRRLAIAKTTANHVSSPLSKPKPRGWRVRRSLAPEQTARKTTLQKGTKVAPPRAKVRGRRQIREVRTGVAASGADVSASPAPSNSRTGNTVARENGLNCDCSSERVHRRPTEPSPRSYASGNCNHRPDCVLTLHRKAPRVRQCRECRRGMRWYPPASFYC